MKARWKCRDFHVIFTQFCSCSRHSTQLVLCPKSGVTGSCSTPSVRQLKNIRHQETSSRVTHHTCHLTPHIPNVRRHSSPSRHTSHLTQAHASHTTRHTSQLVRGASSVVRHGAVQRPEDSLSVRTRVCVELVRAEAWCVRRHYVRAVPVGELAEPSSKVLHGLECDDGEL